MMLRPLLRDRRGVTATEFALVAPVFLAFMFLIIDGARMAWSFQALQEVATNSARCAALGATGCTDSAGVKSHAVDRAAANGIKISATAVTLNNAATCSSVSGMTKVAISTTYQGASTKLLPSTLTTLAAESCFPTAPSS